VIEVVSIDTPSLGDRSYLTTDGEVAVVVDPQRDLDRVMRLVEERQLRLSHVLETHVHNDYVTGGFALAQHTGATYVLNADDDVAFDHHGVTDGDELRTGGLILRVVHTPGHTPTHLSYALHDVSGKAIGVFTGGSMLFGSIGRTDLVDAAMTETLSRSQFRSVRRLAAILPDEVEVHPTHGFGSHCAATQTTRSASTIGAERTDNPALVADDEGTFIRALLSGLHPYPTYYAHMAPFNRSGPRAFEPVLPAPLDVPAIVAAVRAGSWVLDLRDRRAYGNSHLLGTLNAELRNDLPTYVGWLVPFDAAMVLLGDDRDDIAEAQRMLARIGYERLAGQAAVTELDWDGHELERSLRVARFADLDDTAADERTVLDVRDEWEWDSGHHPDAFHVPFHQLADRVGEIPPGRPVWVYCATGARATLAASVLERAGHQGVLVDDFCLPGDVPGKAAAAAKAS